MAEHYRSLPELRSHHPDRSQAITPFRTSRKLQCLLRDVIRVAVVLLAMKSHIVISMYTASVIVCYNFSVHFKYLY